MTPNEQQTTQYTAEYIYKLDIVMFCNRILGLMINKGYYDIDTRGSEYKILIVNTKTIFIEKHSVNLQSFEGCNASLLEDIINIWIPNNLTIMKDDDFEMMKQLIFSIIQDCLE